MAFSTILDVAIALVFMYFLLALIASGIQELIAGFFAWRGTYLSKAIDVILDNNSNASFQWVDFADFMKAHFTGNPGQSAIQRLDHVVATTQNGVSTDAQKVLGRVLNIHTHPLMRNAPSNLPSYVPSRNFALALLETLRDGSQAPLLEQAKRTVDALPAGDLKKTLSLFLTDAGSDIDAFRTHLEHWFDDAMDRLSGIYARLSQYVMLILGLLIACVLNIDSIHVTRTLWESPTIRAAAVASATPSGAPALPTKMTMDATWQDVQSLEDTQIPFGWSFGKPASQAPPNFTVSTIPGWIITAVAVGFGAPFWFSLLQNLTNMRNTGPKPKRSDDKTTAKAGDN
jgi:hypothetical protein